MPRRTINALAHGLALAGAMGALTALAATGPATAAGPPDLHAAVPPAKADHLRIAVADAGALGQDRTYSLLCHPAGGTHPQPEKACAALDAAVKDGRMDASTAADRTRRAKLGGPFAPVPSGTPCTMMHGGPATARITGIWHGKSVDARFDRSNGCEMSRWDRLVPALPDLR
jgi:hypothetical protein